jgi:hypothetical protein
MMTDLATSSKSSTILTVEKNLKRNDEILECQSQLEHWQTRLRTLQQERQHVIALQRVRLNPLAAWSQLTWAQRTSHEFVLAALRTSQPEEMGLPHALQWSQLSKLVKNAQSSNNNNKTNNNNTNRRSKKKKNHSIRHNHPQLPVDTHPLTATTTTTTTWPAMLIYDKEIVLARMARCDFRHYWNKDPFPIVPDMAGDFQIMSALVQQDVMAIQYAHIHLQESLWQVVMECFQQVQQQQRDDDDDDEMSNDNDDDQLAIAHETSRRRAHRKCPLRCLTFFASHFFTNQTYMLQLIQATAHWSDFDYLVKNEKRRGRGGSGYGDDDDDGYDLFPMINRMHGDHNHHFSVDSRFSRPQLPAAAAATAKKQPRKRQGRSTKGTSVLSYLSPELRQDKEFMLQVLQIVTQPIPSITSDMSTTTHNTHGVMTAASSSRRPYPTFLQWCMPPLQKDCNFVMKVIHAAGGYNLQFASPAIRRDYNICRAAMTSCPWAICFCILPTTNNKNHSNSRYHRVEHTPPNWRLQQECMEHGNFWKEQVFDRIIESQRLWSPQSSHGKRWVPPLPLRQETARTLWECVPSHMQQDRSILLLALEAGIVHWSQIPTQLYQIDLATTASSVSHVEATAVAAAGSLSTREDDSSHVVVDPTSGRTLESARNGRGKHPYHEDGDDDHDSHDHDSEQDSDEEDGNGIAQPHSGRNHPHHAHGRWESCRLGMYLYDDDNDDDDDDDVGKRIVDGNDDSASSSSFFQANSSIKILATATDSKFCRTFLQQALERNPTVYLSLSEEEQADPDLAWTAIRSCCQKLKEYQEQQSQQQDAATTPADNSNGKNSSNQNETQRAWNHNDRNGSRHSMRSHQGLLDTTATGMDSSLLLPFTSSSWFSASITDALEDVVAEASVYVPDVMLQDWQVVQYLVQYFVGEELFQWLPPDMRQDKEVMLLACQAHGQFLEYCDEVLWYDRDIVQAALQQSPLAADFLPEVVQLLHIPAIVQAIRDCSEDDIDELTHIVEEEVWLQRDVILAWIGRGRDVREVWDDFDVMLADPRHAWISNDETLWLTMAEFNEEEFRDLAPEELKSNVNFMRQCVEVNGRVLSCALVDDLLLHVDTLLATSFATSSHAIEEFIESVDFEFMVKASRQIRDLVELYQGFVYVLCGIQFTPFPYNEEPSNSENQQQEMQPQCYLPLLNRGLETSLILKQAIADYAGVPRGKQLRLLRQASTNLAAWGF